MLKDILDIGMTPMEPIAELQQKEIVVLELITNRLVSTYLQIK